MTDGTSIADAYLPPPPPESYAALVRGIIRGFRSQLAKDFLPSCMGRYYGTYQDL